MLSGITPAYFLFRDRAQSPARIAGNHTVVRNIFRCDVAQADAGTAPDRYTRHHLRTANPHVVCNRNRPRVFEAVAAALHVNRVARRAKAAVRRDEDMAAKPDPCSAQNHAAMICTESSAHFNIIAVIAPERQLNYNGFARFAQQRFYTCRPYLSHGGLQRIVHKTPIPYGSTFPQSAPHRSLRRKAARRRAFPSSPSFPLIYRKGPASNGKPFCPCITHSIAYFYPFVYFHPFFKNER